MNNNLPDNRKWTRTMTTITPRKAASSIWDLSRAILGLLENEKIQWACKDGPLCITKVKKWQYLYIGYDKDSFLSPMFCLFSWSEIDKYPGKDRFLLTANTNPFDQYVDQLKEFNLSTPEQVQELIDRILGTNTTDIIQSTQAQILESNSDKT